MLRLVVKRGHMCRAPSAASLPPFSCLTCPPPQFSEVLRGADAMYYPEGDRHAPAAEPVPVNNEGVPAPPSSKQGEEGGGA